VDVLQDLLIQKNFGGRVRDLRKQKGLSQEDLALACGLEREFVGGVERGERSISLVNICRVAKAMAVDVRDLF
jgi:transcriptional regulator with XRE-family HTH domain